MAKIAYHTMDLATKGKKASWLYNKETLNTSKDNLKECKMSRYLIWTFCNVR